VHPGVTIHEFRKSRHCPHTVVTIVGNSRAVANAGSLFGSDQYYAVCTSRTINGGRRSVFENINPFNVLGIKELNTVGNDAVHYIQGIASFDRLLASYLYVETGTRTPG